MPPPADRRLAAWVGLGLLGELGLKAAFAARFPLFPDEAFYWQCSQRLDLAYADHPPATALLVRLGTAVLGPTPLGVRWPFLLLGAALPGAIFLLARPLCGRRQAWLAAALALVVPVTALSGAVAGPDAPLLLLSALALAGFERATRTGGVRAWLAAGLAGAAGLVTHYRFALLPASALLYLVATPRGRAALRSRGPWLALALLVLGALPALLFNLRFDFAPLWFQLVGRQSSFRAGGIAAYFAQQLAVTTPLVWAAALLLLWRLFRLGHRGDDRAALFAVTAALPLAAFALASPWADPRHLQAHWPAPGYLPLLALLPGVWLGEARRGGWPRALAWAAPVSSAAVLVGAGVLFATGAGPGAQLRVSFPGWQELGPAADAALARMPAGPGARPLVVGDNFAVAAELDFRLRPRADVYVLDHRRNREYGRQLQYRIFGRDEHALRAHAGEDALVVVEISWLHRRERAAWLGHVRSLFERLEPLGQVAVPAGRHERRFLLFEGVGLRPASPG